MEEPPDPFEHADDFIAWLNEPRDSTGLSRYLLCLWQDRPDIQQSFPDIQRADAEHYHRALMQVGESEEHLPPELLPTHTSVNRPVSTSVACSLASGVNVVGYLTAELGIGEAARQLVGALATTGVPYSTVVYRDTISRQDHEFADDGIEQARFDTNLLCINADRLPQFARDVGPAFFDGRYSIGVWWWEVSVFPEEFHEAFDLVDEIWVGSEFVRKAISASTTKPVHVVPLPVSVPGLPVVTRADLGIPEGFLFLFLFDFLA